MSENTIYRDLQQHLDKFPIGFPSTESGVEIEILEYLFSKEEAKVALCLGLAANGVSRIGARFRKKFGEEMKEENLSQILHKMFMKGNIDCEGDDKNPKYRNAMLVIGMFEFRVNDLEKKFLKLLKRYLDEGFKEEFFRTALPQLRTSPHAKAIVPEVIIDTYDNMREYVKNYGGTIQVLNCICKQGEEILGHPCKQTDNIEICLMFDVQNFKVREKGRTITKEECLSILGMAEERGLVLQPGNTYDPFCICLCCGCCCGVLTAAKTLEKPAKFFATNYYAEVEGDGCVGCGICVERCQMDAIVLQNKKVEVDLDRCIGCGLCVTRCPKNVLNLRKKEKRTVPFRNCATLYLSILKKKIGKKKMMINLARLLFGKQLE